MNFAAWVNEGNQADFYFSSTAGQMKNPSPVRTGAGLAERGAEKSRNQAAKRVGRVHV